MYKNSIILALSAFFLFFLTANGENNTNSPYSRYGYGDLQPSVFGTSSAMGGIGYGVRSNLQINPKNPASYTAVDSLTFMFDLGVSGRVTEFNSGSNQQYKSTGSFDYIAFQLPVLKWLATSVGLIPFSSVGYDYSFSDTVAFNGDELPTTQSFSGTGGISQLYGGLSANVFDRFAVGANARYLFGTLSNTRLIEFPDNSSYLESEAQSNLYVSSFVFDFVFQYTQPIGQDILVLGGTYTMKTPMNIRCEEKITTNDTITDNTDYKFDYPQTIGVGFTYKVGKKLTFGADYSLQKFADTRFYGVKDSLEDKSICNLGLEYLPNVMSRSYFNNVRYRLGANLSNSYNKINESSYDELAVTLGLGFPLRNTRTMLNVLFEYGKRGTVEKNLMQEDYFKVGLNISINENWFFKRKFE